MWLPTSTSVRCPLNHSPFTLLIVDVFLLIVDEGFASAPLDLTPAANGNTPVARILDLVSAAFLPNAVQYDLRLSVLLKGARGIGKQTAARWAAQETGIHLIEVRTSYPENYWISLLTGSYYMDLVRSIVMMLLATLTLRLRPHSAFDSKRQQSARHAFFCSGILRRWQGTIRPWKQGKVNDEIFMSRSTIPDKPRIEEPPIATILQDCLSDLKQSWMMSGYPVFTFATTTEPEKIPQSVLSCFKHEIAFDVRNCDFRKLKTGT